MDGRPWLIRLERADRSGHTVLPAGVQFIRVQTYHAISRHEGPMQRFRPGLLSFLSKKKKARMFLAGRTDARVR